MVDNSKTIAQVAKEVLNKENRLLSLDELHNLIESNKLYFFKKGTDSRGILSKELRKKCINQKHSQKSKESFFFYDYKANKYGLLNWVSQEQAEKYIQEFESNKFSKQTSLPIDIMKTETKNTIEQVTGLQIISLISAIWTLFIIVFFFNDGGMKLDLNAMGDYLAGFFAPLLFIWLVYGVFLQKEEFGKVVASFELQEKEFSDSVKAMKEQVSQVEIQHLHTWFNRNIRMIESIKSSMFRNLNISSVDSIALIKNGLQEDIVSNHIKYFNTYDELKNILDLMLYMQSYLEKFSEEYKDNNILHRSIEELLREFDMLIGEEKKNIEEIMLIVYTLIVFSEKEEYNAYAMYRHWVKEDSDILNIIVTSDGDSDVDKLDYIARKASILSQSIDFREISGGK